MSEEGQYEARHGEISHPRCNRRTTREAQATPCVSLRGGITPRFGRSGGRVCIKERVKEAESELGLERVGLENA